MQELLSNRRVEGKEKGRGEGGRKKMVVKRAREI